MLYQTAEAKSLLPGLMKKQYCILSCCMYAAISVDFLGMLSFANSMLHDVVTNCTHRTMGVPNKYWSAMSRLLVFTYILLTLIACKDNRANISFWAFMRFNDKP